MTLADLLIVFNLIILESLLSVDNAAVLATMVEKLPEDQRAKALKYGIGGAFFFRGLCLLFASLLVKVLWLKIAGGIFLLYLAYGHFTPQKDTLEEGIDETSTGVSGWVYRQVMRFKGYIGDFWLTVALVELMDISFSLDNVFAAVALTNKLWLILLGVFIGIVAMRFVAQWFVTLIKRHPVLKDSAFTVIALLGGKLILSGILDYVSGDPIGLKSVMSSHWFDFSFSAVMMLIFFVPIVFKKKHLPSKPTL